MDITRNWRLKGPRSQLLAGRNGGKEIYLPWGIYEPEFSLTGYELQIGDQGFAEFALVNYLIVGGKKHRVDDHE